jgi:hypothetical protein
VKPNGRDGKDGAGYSPPAAELDAEGRFSRVEEPTLMLEGAESDRAIGNIK